jgi:5'-3' exonuclease
MGVAGLFRQIIKLNKKSHSHQLNKIINYFMIDFNGIVYKAQPILDGIWKDKNKVLNENNLKSYEEELINTVIEYIKKLINVVVNPSTLVYIAVDGPAPRAKMVQQRSRRYKGIKDKDYKDNIKKTHNIPINKNSWNASSNMAPGTEFMYNLTNKMKEVIEKNGFANKENTRDIIFSSGQIPGEGEHKFMPYIRRMYGNKLLNDKTICIYSGDGDLIPLSIVSNKNNIYLLKEVDSGLIKELPQYENKEWIFTDIDVIKDGLEKLVSKHLNVNDNIKSDRFTLDYTFLLSMGGTDFVHGLPYTFVKFGMIEKNLLPAYWETYDLFGEYWLKIVKNGNKKKRIEINMEFMKSLFENISELEDDEMKKYQKDRITKVMAGNVSARTYEMESKMTPYEKDVNIFEHTEIHSPRHPLYNLYIEDFMKIDYKKPIKEWKEEYYSFYFGLNPKNDEYKQYIHKICEQYLKTLYWNIQYYFEDCPSWTFHYGFRVSPMISDVLAFLNETKFDLNSVEFDLGKPYTPYQQLMLILPPQMKHILPESIANLMTDPKKLLLPYYPIDFRVDVTTGLKWMYSEAILPEIDDEFLLDIVKNEEMKLTGIFKDMNKVELNPMRKLAKKK